MKKVLSLLLCLLLCVGIGGGAYAIYKNMDKIESPTTSGSTSTDDKDSSVVKPPVNDGTGDTNDSSGNGSNNDSSGGSSTNTPETPDEPTEPELTPPANIAALTESRLQMMGGAAVYMGDDESMEPAIRFTCMVENSLLDEVNANSNKTLAMMIAPMDFFDTVNTENKTCIDWVNAFADEGKAYILETFDDTNMHEYDSDTSFYRFNLTKVLYNNMNRRFTAIGVLIDNSGGTPGYKYGTMPDGQTYRTNARSVAYVSGAALNAHILGDAVLSDENASKLNSYINIAVDKANGLAESTDDNSKPTVTITSGNSVKLSLNGTHQIQCVVTPTGLDVPVRYVSSNTSVVIVDGNGKITAKGYGSATVKVCVAGVVYTVSVTVSSNA